MSESIRRKFVIKGEQCFASHGLAGARIVKCTMPRRVRMDSWEARPVDVARRARRASRRSAHKLIRTPGRRRRREPGFHGFLEFREKRGPAFRPVGTKSRSAEISLVKAQ